jgi:DNA invertase Pin-like site-specific DNA recombinase
LVHIRIRRPILQGEAKEESKYKGRAPTAQAKSAKVLFLYAKGVAQQDIAAACDIGIASVYRILKAAA